MSGSGDYDNLEDGELPEEPLFALAETNSGTCSRKRKHNSADYESSVKIMLVDDSPTSSLISAKQLDSSPVCLGNVSDSGGDSEGEGGALVLLEGDSENGGLTCVDQPQHSDSVSVRSPNGEGSSQEGTADGVATSPRVSDDKDDGCVDDDTEPSTSTKLTEFEIIDDISDSEVNGYDSDEFDDDDGDWINEEDIDAMLDEGMVNHRKTGSAGESQGEAGDDEFAPPVEKEKVVLIGKQMFFDRHIPVSRGKIKLVSAVINTTQT